MQALTVINFFIFVKTVSKETPRTHIQTGGFNLNLQHRLNAIKEQPRSYSMGTVEFINEQWIFFDDENEEASLLEELVEREIEVFTLQSWIGGTLTEEGLLKTADYFYQLTDGDCVRVRKHLPHTYKALLEAFPDEVFVRFTSTLNKFSYSLYDCIYCHNHMMFHDEIEHYHGVNFINFDNTEIVCAVLHHFERGKKNHDRFEFTWADGKRSILMNLN